MWSAGILVLCLGMLVSGQTPAPWSYPPVCAPKNQTMRDPAAPNGTVMPLNVPTIPDTFQLRVEANILDKSVTWTAEEYYDDRNNRAALRLLRNNTMDYMLFDYTNDQIVYDVNDKCFVTKLDKDPYDNEQIFGIKGGGGIPHIYTTSSALQYSIANGLLYKGTKRVRGINCDWWQSCMYWSHLGANFTLDYYFSLPNWTAADLSSMVPVMAEVQGVSFTGPFHHKYEYVDYRNRLWADPSVFDTPKGKICPGRTQTRKVPQLSGQYSYREEIVDIADNAISEADVYYDYTYSLVRFDYRPSGAGYPYYATNPVSEIHDYSTGIAYAIDKYLGNCSMIPIQNTTFDASVKLSVNANNSQQQFYIHMKSPSQLFYLDNTSYTYEGTRTVRGILCDVFISNRTDFHLPNINGIFPSTFEFYFMNKKWQSSSTLGAHSKLNANIPVQLRISTPDWVHYTSTYNIYNFDAEDPSYNRFSVAGCYDDFSKMSFIIKFPGTWDSSLMQYKNQFIRQITNKITTVGHVSHIRIQNGQFHVNPDSVYFVATLLDLPPPIAYFRKLPGLFRQFTNDKTVVVSSAADCALACNDPNTLGQCNSFDYCAYQNLCGLSKAHTEDGKVIVSSHGQCDHYVRTTQTISLNSKLDDAWLKIKNEVLIGNFQINVNINGKSTKFIAGTIDDHVLQNAQRTSATQSLMSKFNMQYNKNIPGYDTAMFTGIAIDECASTCLQQQSWVCNSFSYCFNTGYCTISKLHPDERPSAVKDSPQCDLYTKKYTVNYQLFKGTTVLSGSDTIYQNIFSADVCGKLCSNYNGFNCKSFDYCDDISTCYLGRTHYYDAPQADKLDSPMCNHYSRKYLTDFQVTKRQHLTNTGDRIITKVSVDQCAKLCVESETMNCASFGYCGDTECRLSTASMRNIGQVSSEASLLCDVYNRQTFPDGTPYINNPSKYYSLPPSSGKYTGGAMAGLAFGMLIVGILIAVGVYIGISKYRGKPLEAMAVSFVKQEGE